MSQSINQLIHTVATQVGEGLQRINAKVTVAESCTGGGIAEAITAVAGSSQWFEYGFITYANKAKVQLLDVEQSLLDTYGAVSEQVVEQMAAGAVRASNSDYAIAVSGIAGPDGGTVEKPVGTVWVCWITPSATRVEKYQLQGDRQAVRQQVIEISLQELLHQLNC
ncbi:CinA family protein [Porticoccaceae bacterium]|nr:CinA family protein [Porticoccaceae bacterium]MDA9570038.1 CinA family protein [Porticoccaceae bacterium]